MSIYGCLRLALPLLAAAALSVVSLACGGGDAPEVTPERPARELPPLASGNDAGAGASPSDLRTMVAMDLIRVREEHANLIASIPTATPVPTEAPSSIASRYLIDGQSPEAEQNLIADPTLGVWWFRQAGGDWTGRGVRERNPYARLFYAPEFGSEHDSFENGRIQERVGQMLVAQAVVLLPELESQAIVLLAPVTERLGWEMASEELPVMRVCSRFTYLAPGDFEPREYRIGGVLSFGVSDRREADTGDVLYQYAVIGDWLGPVLLEEAP